MTFDVKPYTDFWNAKNREDRFALASIIEAARKEAMRIAQSLKAEAAVESVILFGSLAEGGPATMEFDIDLAVRGGDFQKAFRVAQSEQFRIDLVEYDQLPSHVRQRIDSRGLFL